MFYFVFLTALIPNFSSCTQCYLRTMLVFSASQYYKLRSLTPLRLYYSNTVMGNGLVKLTVNIFMQEMIFVCNVQ